MGSIGSRRLLLLLLGGAVALLGCNGVVASAPMPDATADATPPAVVRVDCNDGSGKRDCCSAVDLHGPCEAGAHCLTPCSGGTHSAYDCVEPTHVWSRSIDVIACTPDSVGVDCHDGAGKHDCCAPKAGVPCVSGTMCLTACFPYPGDTGSRGSQKHIYCDGTGTWVSGLGLIPCDYKP